MQTNFALNKTRDWLYLAIILALIFRFFYGFIMHPFDHLYSDPDRHYTNVNDENFGKSIYSILDSPLPQFWLKAVFFVLGNTTVGASVYLGLLSVVMPWFWYRWGRELFKKKDTALILCAAIAWLPSWIGIYSFFMDETLSIIALGASLWLSWRAKRKQTLGSLVIAAIAWSIAMCIKQIVMFELIIIMPWLLISYLKHHGRNLKSYAAVFAASSIIICAYLTYPLWVYIGLGSTWLLSPAMGCMTRAYYLSGALSQSATFLTHGTLIWQTGHFGSNAMCTESLSPFWNWKTWRVGSYNLVINLDRPVYLAMPTPHPPWPKRLLLFAESILYFFFSRSWPDDRSDDWVQIIQINLRWLWSILPLSILIIGMRKKLLKEMPVVLCLGTALLYVTCDCSTLEGRYRKPWEGTAIAAFIYVLTEPKKTGRKLSTNKDNQPVQPT